MNVKNFSDFDLKDILIEEDEYEDQYEADFENETTNITSYNDTFLNDSQLLKSEIKDISSPEITKFDKDNLYTLHATNESMSYTEDFSEEITNKSQTNKSHSSNNINAIDPPPIIIDTSRSSKPQSNVNSLPLPPSKNIIPFSTPVKESKITQTMKFVPIKKYSKNNMGLYSTTKPIPSQNVPGLNKNKIDQSEKPMNESQVKLIVENILSEKQKTDSSKQFSKEYIQGIMKKAVHLAPPPNPKSVVNFDSGFPKVSEDNTQKFPAPLSPSGVSEMDGNATESYGNAKYNTTSYNMPTVDKINTMPIEFSSSAYLTCGKDPVELTLKCDEIYANFLSDLIDSCKKQAALSISIEEMAMHRVLAEQLGRLYSDSRSIQSIRAKMIWAAREASLYVRHKK